jgi:A/G-specific adenine glycosylase
VNPTPAGKPPQGFQWRLRSWYDRNQRPLPWRKNHNAYRVWLSEVMLQQTTVKTMLPYYAAFLKRFPNLETLAAADEEDVVAAWSGLGYYHRARNLHRGAQHIVQRNGGRFPRTLEATLAIPGVGLYTASAVLSICYSQPLPVVDGNVRRVLARLFALRGPEWQKDGPYYNRAEELLDREAPGAWNQAVMELGALVCTPKQPSCPACPVRRDCRALAENRVSELPEPRARRAVANVTVAAVFVERGERLLLVQRGEGRLMTRMWELPRSSLDTAGRPDLLAELRSRYGLSVSLGDLVARTKHTITHRKIQLEAYRAVLKSRDLPTGTDFRWVTREELAALPVAAITRKLLRAVDASQRPLPLG